MKEQIEIWKDIPGHEGYYQASNLGRIKSLPRIVSPCFDKQTGYLKVQLSNDKNSKRHTLEAVHRLVCKAFVPGYFEGAEVNHKDGNKLNNVPDNFEWCTPKYNIEHAYKIGLRESVKGINHCNAKVTEEQVREIRKMHENGMPHNKIAEVFPIHKSSVYAIIKRWQWKHV